MPRLPSSAFVTLSGLMSRMYVDTLVMFTFWSHTNSQKCLHLSQAPDNCICSRVFQLKQRTWNKNQEKNPVGFHISAKVRVWPVLLHNLIRVIVGIADMLFRVLLEWNWERYPRVHSYLAYFNLVKIVKIRSILFEILNLISGSAWIIRRCSRFVRIFKLFY